MNQLNQVNVLSTSNPNYICTNVVDSLNHYTSAPKQVLFVEDLEQTLNTFFKSKYNISLDDFVNSLIHEVIPEKVL